MSGESDVVLSVKPANKVVLNEPAKFNRRPAAKFGSPSRILIEIAEPSCNVVFTFELLPR